MRFAVIGCGAIGSRYLEWVRDMGHEAAGCDPDPGRREQIFDDLGIAAFATIEETLQWAPQRVLVATPPDLHEQTARPIAEAGIPLLIEKPVAHTLAAAKDIAVLAHNSNGPVNVVCNMRFHAGVRAIHDNLPRIGQVLTFRGVFGHRLSQMRKTGGDFARNTVTGGGVVLDCIHEFDYLSWLFGPAAEVKGHCARVGVDPIDAEDLAEVLFHMQSGVTGSLHLDFLMRQKRRGLEVIGSEANLVWLSTGKAPEVCTVTLSTNEKEEMLLDIPSIDARDEYAGMLARFIDGGDGLQTVDEAVDALEAALIARDGEAA